VVCGKPSEQARCPDHRYTRQRGAGQRRQRLRIIERDGFRCVKCGKYVTGGMDTHVDHIVALANGGDEGDANKQTLCAPCNRAKQAS
jgi:5-methylcytosine-specific restriction endonuclease McrA